MVLTASTCSNGTSLQLTHTNIQELLLAALYCFFVFYLVGFSVLGRVSVVVRDSKKQMFIFEESIFRFLIHNQLPSFP